MASIRLNVSGMTCAHCRGRVEGAVKAVAGVYGVYVDLSEGSAEVDFDGGKTNPEALAEVITTAGYPAKIAD